MLRCLSLAQADAKITKELIEIDGCIVETLVEMLSPAEYMEALTTDSGLQEFDALLRDSYNAALENNFVFKEDAYGGYGLFYVGENQLRPRKSHPVKMLPSVIGFVEKIPQDSLASFKDISIFRKTDACSFDRVMLGPTRFANHSCQPNCRYALKEVHSRRCIQLEILEPINKNDEITVSYGINFFGEGNQDCRCVHIDMHQEKLNSEDSISESRRRLDLCSASYRQRRQSILRIKRRKKYLKQKIEMRCFDSSSSSGDIDSDVSGSSEETSLSTKDFLQPTNLVSSPNHENNHSFPSFSVSTIDCANDSSESSDNSESHVDAICTFSRYNFTICVNEIIARHGTSDAEATDWIKLMKTAFPENKIPSFKSLKRDASRNVVSILKTSTSCGEGECISLDFVQDLLVVLKTNFPAISEYSSSRSPLKDVSVPQTFGSNNIMTISLTMNSDGVRIVNSKKRSLWPLWLSVLNLPPILRCKFVNIVLAKLWLGQGKPDWEIFFSEIKDRLSKDVSIEYNGISWNVVFEVKLLVADLPAKASILNMQQFNAYFGCTLCLIECKPIGDGKKGLYYPNQRNKMRTAEQHQSYLKLMQKEGLQTFRGIKGTCVLSDLIENLPLTAPIDYMHQVLLGVTRSILFLIRDKTSKTVLIQIREVIDSVQLTSDFKRALRNLEDLEYFKANELKVWLLYVGPVVFHGFIDKDFYERFFLLSYTIRLLLFSTEYCSLADQLIERFHLLTAESYTDKVFSANLHSLNHLAWQVKCFGPLWCTSAIMFESANYLLRCKFTGTVNHLKVLVERYIRNKESHRESPRKDTLLDLCLQFRDKKKFKRHAVQEIPPDLQNLSAQFYSSQKFENFSIDSESSFPSKNSFVSFISR